MKCKAKIITCRPMLGIKGRKLYWNAFHESYMKSCLRFSPSIRSSPRFVLLAFVCRLCMRSITSSLAPLLQALFCGDIHPQSLSPKLYVQDGTCKGFLCSTELASMRHFFTLHDGYRPSNRRYMTLRTIALDLDREDF